MKLILGCLLFTILTCFVSEKEVKSENEIVYKSDDLVIHQLTPKIYRHVTYLYGKTFGRVACNGMIVVDGGEAAVFDTPITDSVSAALIAFIEAELDSKVEAVVINHFHIDCLGGLGAFHEKGIPSFASLETIALAEEDNAEVPQHGFSEMLSLRIGNERIINQSFGEAHTSDNIVSYVPSEKVLFGGCAVKSLKAGKGNLADATVEEWSNTIRSIKTNLPDIEHVIPGHGSAGGVELLDYTIEMFDTQK